MPDRSISSPDLHKNTTRRKLISTVNPPTEETYVIVCRLKAGARPQFMALLGPVLDAMRHEDTFVNAVLHQDPASADTYMLYETWLDGEDVMNVQMHRPYRQAFWEALPELLSQPRQIQVWKPMRSDLTIG